MLADIPQHDRHVIIRDDIDNAGAVPFEWDDTRELGNGDAILVDNLITRNNYKTLTVCLDRVILLLLNNRLLLLEVCCNVELLIDVWLEVPFGRSQSGQRALFQVLGDSRDIHLHAKGDTKQSKSHMSTCAKADGFSVRQCDECDVSCE